MLETTMNGHRTSGDEVVQGKRVKGTECTPQTLDSLINHFS